MIAKHVPMRSIKKSDFAELVKYITDEQGKTEADNNFTQETAMT
ncbi:hypothetical protein [Saccharopolyspora spinosa]|nr:hypothetical protein [Saccharopolyspora spinosa]